MNNFPEWEGSYSIAQTDVLPQFNSRIETVETLGLWKSAFAWSRCIVPMRGYYEWTQRDELKIPHFIHCDADVLAAAGMNK